MVCIEENKRTSKVNLITVFANTKIPRNEEIQFGKFYDQTEKLKVKEMLWYEGKVGMVDDISICALVQKCWYKDKKR